MASGELVHHPHRNALVLSSKRAVEDEVQKLRLEGNSLFAKKAFERAASKYTSALNVLSIIGEASTRAVILSNRAACYLGLYRYDEAIKDCQDSLAADPTFVKSHLRLSKALEDLGDANGALNVLVAASNINQELNSDFELRHEIERLSKSIVDKLQVSATWRKLTVKGKPPQLIHCSSVEWNGKIFIFGGMNSQNETGDNQVYVFDTEQLEWSIAKAQGMRPAARSYHSAVIYQNAMLVMGGNHSGFFDMWRLDLVTFVWSQVHMLGHYSQFPPGLTQFMTCVYKDVLFVWGGFFTKGELGGKLTNNDALFCLDLHSGEWKKHSFNGDYFPQAVQDRGIWVIERNEIVEEDERKSIEGETEKDGDVNALGRKESASSLSDSMGMLNISDSEKSRAPNICPIKPWLNSGEIYAIGGSKKYYLHRLGVMYDETAFSLDKFSIRENKWEPMAIVGSAIPTPRSLFSTLYFPEKGFTFFFGGFHEGIARKEPPCFFNESFGFHSSVGVFFKITSRGDRIKAGAKYWALRRKDGRVFVGGGYCKNTKLEIFRDVYEVVVQDGSEREAMRNLQALPTVKTNLLTNYDTSVEKSLEDEDSNQSDDSPRIRLGSVSAEAFTKILRERGDGGEGEEEEGDECGEVYNVDMDKPQGEVNWRIMEEEPWDPPNPNFNFMLAKLEYASRQNMGMKTTSELKAATQPMKFKEINLRNGLTIPRAFELHVRLRFLHPSVWRRVVVPARMTLAQLHEFVLCPAIGWCRNYHAYKMRRSIPEKDETWFGPTNSLAPDYMKARIMGEGLADDTKVFIGDVLTQVGDSLAYIYDFNCNWDHEITLVRKINNPSRLQQVSVEVLDGWGACPAEDCGGITNYFKLLNVISDPKHPKFQQIYTALRNAKNKNLAHYDPCQCDLEAMTQAVTDALALCRASQKQAWFVGPENFQRTKLQAALPQPQHASMPAALPPVDMCRICGRTDGLMACGACHVAWYCGVQHQQQDWIAGHCYTCPEERARAMEAWAAEPR